MLKELTHDINEIFAGTINHLDPIYIESSKSTKDKDGINRKMIDRLQRMVDSYSRGFGFSKSFKIDDEDNKMVNKSQGDIRKLDHEAYKNFNSIFDCYDNLEKNASHTTIFRDAKVATTFKNIIKSAKNILTYLVDHVNLYTKGYIVNSQFVIQEYQACAYILILGTSYYAATINYELNITKINTIKIEAVSQPDLFGNKKVFKDERLTEYGFKQSQKQKRVIEKVMVDMDRELHKQTHVKYLQTLIDATKVKPSLQESARLMCEEAIGATIEILATITKIRKLVWGIGETGFAIIKMIINTMNNIIPLIRTIIAMKFNKKIDAINSLEEQAHYLELNIQQLRNKSVSNKSERNKLDSTIKKQEAIRSGMLKKAAKLKIEFGILEDETEKIVTANNNKIAAETNNQPTPPPSNDDLVLD